MNCPECGAPEGRCKELAVIMRGQAELSIKGIKSFLSKAEIAKGETL